MKEEVIIATMESLTSGLRELTNIVTPLVADETPPRGEQVRQSVVKALDAASDLTSALQDLEDYTFPYEESDDPPNLFTPTEEDPC